MEYGYISLEKGNGIDSYGERNGGSVKEGSNGQGMKEGHKEGNLVHFRVS